jgi:hypothetical protein
MAKMLMVGLEVLFLTVLIEQYEHCFHKIYENTALPILLLTHPANPNAFWEI